MTPSKTKHSPKFTLNVTQELIDKAIPRDSGHCMIAEALAVARPAASYISVDLATIRFTDLAAGQRYIYLTPRTAQLALLAFDRGEPFEPFTITIQGAHVLPTGTGRKGRTTLVKSEGGTTMKRAGGQSPPLGPLLGGAPKRQKPDRVNGASTGNRTGRRREYGLRELIR